MAITQEQIIEAAEEIQENGSRPTAQLVRERLGSGSFATISPVLKAWRASLDSEDEEDTPEIPETLTKTLDKLTQRLWRDALKAAQEDLSELRDDALAQINESQTAEKEALDAVAKMESELDSLARDLDQQANANSELKKSLDEAGQKYQDLVNKLDATAELKSGALSDLARSEERSSLLSGQLSQVQKQLEKAESEGAKLKTESHANDTRANKAEQALEMLETSSQKEISRLTQQLESTQSELADAKKEAEEARRSTLLDAQSSALNDEETASLKRMVTSLNSHIEHQQKLIDRMLSAEGQAKPKGKKKQA